MDFNRRFADSKPRGKLPNDVIQVSPGSFEVVSSMHYLWSIVIIVTLMGFLISFILGFPSGEFGDWGTRQKSQAFAFVFFLVAPPVFTSLSIFVYHIFSALRVVINDREMILERRYFRKELSRRQGHEITGASYDVSGHSSLTYPYGRRSKLYTLNVKTGDGTTLCLGATANPKEINLVGDLISEVYRVDFFAPNPNEGSFNSNVRLFVILLLAVLGVVVYFIKNTQ